MTRRPSTRPSKALSKPCAFVGHGRFADHQPEQIGAPLCLVTRLEMPRVWHVGRVILAFTKMKRARRVVPGFLDATLYVRRRRVVIIVSWWTDDRAIAEFATAVPDHLAMVRWAFRQGARTWSGLYELKGLSPMTRTRNFGVEVLTA
jgi:hypothetical protein